MNPMALSILMISLAIGTATTLASHHWLLAWVGLEINTIAIIPLMTKNFHPRAVEAATKYFLTQATASALILLACSYNAWKLGEWSMSEMTSPSSLILSIALMTKLGLAPMHFWMPDVLQGIPLSTGLILSTWQKIAPMALLIQMSHNINLNLAIAVGVTSILIGGWGGIGQTQMRKIMAFSSIAHLGWIIMVIKFNPSLALFSFIVYILLTTAMFSSLITLSMTNLSQMSTSWSKSPMLTSSMILILLSLAGLPPLTGFGPKLLISLELVKQGATPLMILISLASLLSLFFYLRLAYVMALSMAPNTSTFMIKWRTPAKFYLATIFNVLVLLTFPITPIVMILM
uniref:NADH dehydrogenase subunit 2 n=1 Tax=Ptychadena anchietae TaxID=127654 RepID=UPI00286AA730|nr:NADH dehydrogenase subunit 2 [Ptychadena anchietae]WKT09014.1 NADH dehydrogenase subunit 2 [Ptychadena anchietae]